MNCPNCRSNNVSSVSEVTTTSDTKGYSCCAGGLGAIIFGPIGWLCGLLGMGEGRTTTRTTFLWVCNDCGRKFR